MRAAFLHHQCQTVFGCNRRMVGQQRTQKEGEDIGRIAADRTVPQVLCGQTDGQIKTMRGKVAVGFRAGQPMVGGILRLQRAMACASGQAA